MSEAQATAASGLQIGQTIDVAALDVVSQKLLDTGLFKKLSYRYRTNNDGAVVTFVVEETRGGVPVVFDNFVWFTEEELRDAVRREVPAFDGTAPESGGAAETIARALGQLLRERKIEGQVEYTPSADLSGANSKHIFAVKGVAIPICALSFAGASGIQESELVTNSKALLNNDYSAEFVGGFAKSNLIPLYRQRGHLRAAFGRPTAKLSSASNCRNGVAVTIPVEEGQVYMWSKAEWEGNNILSSTELESLLGMRQGEVANGMKFDQGIIAVRDAYGKRGFITARLSGAPEFNDANKRVTYRITIKEGTLFRMGTLVVNGLSEAEAGRIKYKWKLQSGEVYDASYLKEFLKNIMPEMIAANSSKARNVAYVEKPDRQRSTVDVVLTFK